MKYYARTQPLTLLRNLSALFKLLLCSLFRSSSISVGALKFSLSRLTSPYEVDSDDCCDIELPYPWPPLDDRLDNSS
jgi:hypothetical protein